MGHQALHVKSVSHGSEVRCTGPYIAPETHKLIDFARAIPCASSASVLLTC